MVGQDPPYGRGDQWKWMFFEMLEKRGFELPTSAL